MLQEQAVLNLANFSVQQNFLQVTVIIEFPSFIVPNQVQGETNRSRDVQDGFAL